MRITDVQHQERAHRVLQRALGSNRMPHAYIFHGPPGVGKGMMALRLARLLLCDEPAPIEPPAGVGVGTAIAWRDACGRCRNCELVEAGTHPDLHLISKELHQHHPDPSVRQRKGLDLSVEVIRHFVIEPAGIRSACGGAKVFVVQEAERMTLAAQNALLKTLEEPPSGTFLILLVEQLEQLMPTILSRSQQAAFCALPKEFVHEVLTGDRAMPGEAARFCAALSDGRLGLATEYAEDDLFALKRQVLSEWANYDGRAPTELARTLEDAARELAKRQRQHNPRWSQGDAVRRGLRTILSVLAGAYRDCLLAACGGDVEMIHADQPEVIERLAARWSGRSADVIELIAHAERQIEQNVNPTLALEGLVVRAWAQHGKAPASAR